MSDEDNDKDITLEDDLDLEDGAGTGEPDKQPDKNINNDTQKQPNIWKAIRGIQKTLQEMQKPLKEPSEKQESDFEIRKTVDGLALSEKKRDFADEHGLKKQEVDFLFTTAAGYGVEPSQLLDKEKFPHIQAALDSMKAQRRVQENTPSPSSPSLPIFEGKKFNELKPEDMYDSLRKNYAKAIDSVKK